MKKIILTFIILFFVCPAVPLLPQDDPITLSSGVDKSRITIGDLITYTVTVTHDKEVLLVVLKFGITKSTNPLKKKDKLFPEWIIPSPHFLRVSLKFPL